MKRGHMTAAWVAVAVMAPLLSGCGTIGANLIREPGGSNQASTLVLDQRRIEEFGFDGAVKNLIAMGVKPTTAHRRVTEAQLVLGAKKEQ